MNALKKILIGLFLLSIIAFILSLGTNNCNETNSNSLTVITQLTCDFSRFCKKVSIVSFLVSILGFIGIFFYERKNNY